MTSFRGLSAEGLRQRIELERAGKPFLECQLGEGEATIYDLSGSGRVTIGRDSESDLAIQGDEKVSRLHAQLERIGESWVIADDGLSRNGTWVGSSRIAGRRRLIDGDTIHLGGSMIAFRAPAERDDRTIAATDAPVAATITGAQRRVLVALCRPFREGSEFAVPATNKEIGAEVYLSIEAVKTHLRALFQRFGVADLPQNQKRLKLVENAIRSGAVTPSELRNERDR